MQEHHLSVQKTARYYTLGELSERTKFIWFVLHGYGQLAGKFLEQFASLDDGEHFFVAPEGLNKFYWKGFGGKPVAHWMTSEDRDNEINDYLAYLNQLYDQIISNSGSAQARDARKVALGFSQGTATVTRWVANDKSSFNHMVLCSGPLAHDINWKDAERNFQQTNNILVIGNKDEFIQASDLEKQKEYLEKVGFEYTFIEFDGGHEVTDEVLFRIDQTIKKKS